VKTSGNEKIRVPTTLAILEQRRKFSNIILWHKTMPRGINDTCNLYWWMTNTLIKNRLAVAWNVSPGVLLRRWWMFHVGCI
jgi:hypothetical protein